MVETKSKSSALIFGFIGLALGFVVGFMLTTRLNQSQSAPGAAGKPPAVKGDEKLPEGHPDISNVNVEEEAKAAVAYGKEHPDYDSQLKVGAYLYVEARRMADAKPYFLKAHEMKPQEFEPIMQLGNLCFDMGQETNNSKLMEEAADWYEKALKIKPDDINVRTDLGITYLLRQPSNPKAALAEFEKSLAVEPKHAPTLYNKARALIGLKDFKAAEETFAQLKEVSPQQELIDTLRAELDKAKGEDSVRIPTH